MRTELLELLRTRSFARRAVTLSSGKTSNFYIDCKQVTLDARGHVLIGKLLFEALRAVESSDGVRFDGVGGLTLGADPLASAVSLTSSLEGHPLPAFIVRKEPKAHGTEVYLEGMGNIPSGGRLAVVEDVVTTGRSAMVAVERVRSAGYRAELVLALVDRLDGGREVIEAAGLKLVTLFDRRDFMGDDGGLEG
ncbi:MAG: orotate phosphoribosyltransferase [Deltaproteobacteria bacterium]|nr:orotate phosphoribosyltransferase [Deltaproteobacteria bacterium]